MAEPNQPSEIAREALRRLAARRLQPTPDNYRNLYHEIAGTAAVEQFPERALKTVVSALPRGTGEQQRFVRQMEAALAARDWGALKAALVGIASRPDGAGDSAREVRATGVPVREPSFAEVRDLMALLLENGVAVLLADAPGQAQEAVRLTQEVRSAGDLAALHAPAARLKQFVFRLQWVAEDQTEYKVALLRVLRLVVDNISELVMDDERLHGQIVLLNGLLAQDLDVRRLEDVERRLKDLIVKQSNLKKSLGEARDRLKTLLARFVDHLAEMTESTAEYQEKIARCAARVSAASDIGALSDVVDEVARETRHMQMIALRSRDELREARARVVEAEREVARLQGELAQAAELVRQDQLTGTLNRKGLSEVLEREVARGQRRGAPLCVAMLDIDNFKKLNDTYGHQTGDQALTHLARVVQDTLRPQDTVARYGGEEFVIVLPETELGEAVAAMTRLQRELTRRIFLHDNEKTLITFSAGVARLGPDDTQEQALARADAAMYEAKRAGKNRVVAADQKH
jgi:diguanylate cyclase